MFIFKPIICLFSKTKGLLLFSFLMISGLICVYIMYLFFLVRDLPSIESLKNYQPPLISTVLDRDGDKVGEFFKERRILVPYSEFPKVLVNAFVAAEDGRFFEHKGINWKAIFRAFLANLKAGKKVQGGSTITQQVARSLLLSSEKTYKRKIKEAILAIRMEKYLSKEDILYLYLNQIYLGHGAYGVGMASEIYFRKKVQDLNLIESALLAGLPQAPSRFSPIYNSKKAKERQLYVLNRMLEENYIDREKMATLSKINLKVFLREKFYEKAPYYIETLRQTLTDQIGEEVLLTGGLTIKSSLSLPLQDIARKSLREGLENLDKRQGFRGALGKLKDEQSVQEFFEKEEKKVIKNRREFKWMGYLNLPKKRTKLLADKNSQTNTNEDFLKGVKEKEVFKALVREVNDKTNKVLVQLPFGAFGFIPLENMDWARTPDPKVNPVFFSLKKPSLALSEGDVILVKIEKKLSSKEEQEIFFKDSFENDFFKQIKKPQEKVFLLSLEQKPLVEGALIAFDQKTGDIVALVGGYDFQKSQFNRAYQATRQTGSVFKPLVYLAALDKGFSPATIITDSPVVYDAKEAEDKDLLEEQKNEAIDEITEKTMDDTTDEATGELTDEIMEEEENIWKPDNYGRRFSGDILFRNALIRSMNVPTIKIIENIGIKWVSDYARRLGIFSPLNPDYTLALGSSSVTLYEITKVFSVLGRLGQKITPLLLREVLDMDQQKVLENISLDLRFTEQMRPWDEIIEEKRENFLIAKKDEESPTEQSPVEIDNEQKEKEESLPAEIDNNKKTKDPAFFFSDPDQLISKKTAFIMTSLLQAAINEPYGTGARVFRELKWPLAGKTGTTNGYYDAWFVGYSSDIAVGVWVGFDDEKSLGQGESGAKAALPIWLNFMKEAHEEEGKEFAIPSGIMFTHIDNETGSLVSAKSEHIVRQAFVEGTEPMEQTDLEEEEQIFLREDSSQ